MVKHVQPTFNTRALSKEDGRSTVPNRLNCRYSKHSEIRQSAEPSPSKIKREKLNSVCGSVENVNARTVNYLNLARTSEVLTNKRIIYIKKESEKPSIRF